MSTGMRIAVWAAIGVGALALITLLSGMLLPFVAGFLIAYFIDPIADRLENAGAPRWLATALILAAFFVVFGTVLVVLAPLIQAQVTALAGKLPALIESLRAQLQPLLESLSERLSDSQKSELKSAAGGHAADMVKWAGTLLAKIIQGGVAVVDMLSLLIVTPVVAFYLLRDFNKLTAHLDGLLPRRNAETIREQMRAIDRTLAAFVRGQATVCLVLGAWYALALTFAGLEFGLLVGIAAGAISFIPYVGAGIGLSVGTALALSQFSEWQPVAMVVAVFVIGQTAESYLLSPKLVGESVGLHPVWLIFALMAGGSLFGFTGVLLGVPVAAVIGVLIRFALRRYREGPLYSGSGSGPP